MSSTRTFRNHVEDRLKALGHELKSPKDMKKYKLIEFSSKDSPGTYACYGSNDVQVSYTRLEVGVEYDEDEPQSVLEERMATASNTISTVLHSLHPDGVFSVRINERTSWGKSEFAVQVRLFME